MVSVDSSTIELTDAQETILSELVGLHTNGDQGPVKGKDIATAIGRNPGTIRTQMQSLKSLQLVNGIPGPRGGYVPTAKAYVVIDLEQSNEFSPVPVRCAGEHLDGVTVTEFDLLNIHHPDCHEAEIDLQGSVREINEGEEITIGPMPASNLVVTGTVEGVDESEKICIIDLTDISFEDTNR